MKKIVSLILFTLFTIVVVAQSNYQDVVYLKNGSIIRGIIIEQVPNKSIKIETVDQSVFVYQMDDIDKLTKEQHKGKSKNIKSLSSSKSVGEGIGGTSFIVKGGLNLSDLLAKDDEDNYSDNFKLKPGFHIGITAELPISETFVFETGLLLSTKGFKMSESKTLNGETYEVKGSSNLLYLDIPLTAKSYFKVGQTTIFGALGPYIGYGLSGKSKYETSMNGDTESDEQDVNWGSGDDDVKRLDFGLTAGAGIEISFIQIGLSYNLGLANIVANTENGMKVNNRVIGLSVGYKFGVK